MIMDDFPSAAMNGEPEPRSVIQSNSLLQNPGK